MSSEIKSISDDQISIVIQGPLLWNKPEGIERCIVSLRHVAPKAEIIVSTWRGENTALLPEDIKTVVSDDPGCFWEHPYRAYNLNRQLVSTAAGISLASRPYVLKIRSDLALFDRRLLQIAEAAADAICVAKITITNLYLRNPEVYPLLYHVSDVVQFGRREDMANYWAGPLFSESEVLLPMQHAGLIRLLTKPRFKLVPEQALTIAWLNRNGQHTSLAKVDDTRIEHQARWSRVLIDNFHLVSWKDSGVLFPMRFLNDPSIRRSLLEPADLKRIASAGFDSRRVGKSRIFGATFLIHSRLSHFVGWLQFNHPHAHRILSRIWRFLLGLNKERN